MTLILAGMPAFANGGNRLVVTVTVDGNSNFDRPLAEAIRLEVGSSPLRIVKDGATRVTVETDQAGYDYLMSADEFASVKLIKGVVDAESAAIDLSSYTIRLSAGASAGDGGKSSAISAVLLARNPGGVEADVTGGGTLLVRALDGNGREVARSQVADPRIIRSESSDASGKISGRHDYMKKDATFTVALPALASIRTLSIEEPDGDALIRLKIR